MEERKAMAENSGIEWTDNTFNPWIGCSKVSPACANCYAERDMDHRYGKVKWGPGGTRAKTSEANWKKPLKWDRDAAAAGVRTRVFCASLADVFEDWDGPIVDHHGKMLNDSFVEASNADMHNDELLTMDHLRRKLFALIDATPNLDWLLLTKRPENVERMWAYRQSPAGQGHLPCTNRDNVWLGTSIENQKWVDKRVPYLHAAKRDGLVQTTFVSAEPLCGPIDLLRDNIDSHLGKGGIDWVIAGGESGPNARPANTAWYRSLRDQCLASETPFLFKQWGEWGPRSLIAESLTGQEQFAEFQPRPDDFPEDFCQVLWGKKKAGRLLDGQTWDGIPKVSQ
jgi:protein gp37